MQIKTLSLIFLITLAANITTPCLAFFWGDHPVSKEQAKIPDDLANYLKGLGMFGTGLLIPIAIESYFEYQDDKAISEIKRNDDEYQNATSWKDKAKISKSIEREYYTTQTLKKKWGRKFVKIAPCLGCLCVASIYFRRFFYSDF